MKRILLFVCILAVAAAPTMVSAQGLPGLGGFPGAGTFGSFFGASGPCGEAKPGLVAPPTFYVGWVGGGDGARVGGGLDTPLAGVNGLVHDYRLDSVALGISGGFRFSDRISIIASGWWVVPATTRSAEDYDPPGFAHREWSADSNWWWVDALAAYDVGGSVAVLGGFRYERFETKFRNARDIAGFGLPGDEANAKSNAYIPLFGLLFSTGSGSNVLTAYAVGFPALPGHAEYRETLVNFFRLNSSGDYKRGFFFETRLEYKRRFMGEADLGAFVTYNVLEGKISSSAEVNPFIGGGGFDGSFNRSAVILGGSLNLPFRLPFM